MSNSNPKISISCPNCKGSLYVPAEFCLYCKSPLPEFIKSELLEIKAKNKREKSIKASKQGAIAAFISCGVTLVFLFFSLQSGETEGIMGLFNDPTIFLDVVLVFVCALGLLRYSRTAAITVFLWFLVGKTLFYIELGKLPGILSFVFLYFYWNAIIGTISYHKIEKEENPEYKQAPKWIYYLGVPCLIGLFLMVIFGLMTMTDFLPSTEITKGEKFSNKNRALLIENGLVLPDEQIEYYYSGGFLSILEMGNVLTDKRVIVYAEDEDKKLQIYEMYYADIVDIKKNEDGDYITDSIYTVTSNNGGWLKLNLSVEGGGDMKFIKALKDRIDQSQPFKALKRSN
jgi:hypothetical protein